MKVGQGMAIPVPLFYGDKGLRPGRHRDMLKLARDESWSLSLIGFEAGGLIELSLRRPIASDGQRS